MLIWKTQKEKQLMSSMTCLLMSTIRALGVIQVCLIKKCYHLSVSRFISALTWIIYALDWILLWSSIEHTHRWHEHQELFLTFYTLNSLWVSATDHRGHQNMFGTSGEKISCALCTTFLSLPIFYVFYDLLLYRCTKSVITLLTNNNCKNFCWFFVK